jgi:molecular chaperone GrpE
MVIDRDFRGKFMFEQSANNPFREEKIEEPQTELTEEAEIQEVETEIADEAEKLKVELGDLNNKFLRMAADFDNYRKRQAQERENLLKYGAAETLTKLFTVLDTIERANSAMENIEDAQTLKENYNVIFKQLWEVLQKCGLEKIETEGVEFDPNLHEAIMQTPTSEHPDHSIIAQLQTGYKLADRVLRPALVNVAVSEE